MKGGAVAGSGHVHSEHPAAPTYSRYAWIVVAIPLLAAMWVTTHPYSGVSIDGRLYAAQALHRLYPARYAGDVSFKYGPQDSFTLFSALYVPLVAAAGVAKADLLATIVGQAVWFGGLLFLARTLFRKDAEFLAASAAVILLNHSYGTYMADYSVAFVSPRTPAEGLTLFAIAFALCRKRGLAAATLFVAALIHPLMALGGAAVLGLRWAFLDRRVWLLFPVAGAVVLALAVAGVPPFDRVGRIFDPTWRAIALGGNADDILISHWPWQHFLQVAAMLFLVGVGGALGVIKGRRLATSIALVGVGSLVVAVVGADMLKDVLVVQLEVWRALWIVAVFANAVIGVLLVRLRSLGLSVVFLAIAAALSGLSQFFAMTIFFAPVVMVAACSILAIELATRAPFKGAVRVLVMTLFGVTFALALLAVCFEITHFPSATHAVERSLVALCALAALILLLRRGTGLMLAVAAVAALVVSVPLANARPAWERFSVSGNVPPGLAAFVPKSGTIYWESDNGLMLLWFKLKRPDYFSCTQGAGIAYNRRTALDYQRRIRALRTLDTEDFADQTGQICAAKTHPNVRGPTSAAQIAEACRALPDLDTLILNRPVPGLTGRSWTAPVAEIYYRADGRRERVQTFHRYDCAALRWPTAKRRP